MSNEGISSLLVVRQGKLVGMITSGDIFNFLIKNPGKDLRNSKCLSIASKRIAVIKPSDDLHSAIKKMSYLKFRRLPVISKGRLLGLITLKDILSADSSLFEYSKDFTDEIREESSKINNLKEESSFTGKCTNCKTPDDLLRVEGMFLCNYCRKEMF